MEGAAGRDWPPPAAVLPGASAGGFESAAGAADAAGVEAAFDAGPASSSSPNMSMSSSGAFVSAA